MSLLPAYRGMNVAKWAALEGEPVGRTIHFIDTLPVRYSPSRSRDRALQFDRGT
jgi:folate-dependent phosphoribosylglycinamide formyltransferase PurN